MIKWKDQISVLQQNKEYAELPGIDGEPIEFEWNIFRGFTSMEILREIHKDLKTGQKNPEQFEGRILFMSMFKGIDRTKNGNSIECIPNSKQVSDHAKRVSARTSVVRRSWE